MQGKSSGILMLAALFDCNHSNIYRLSFTSYYRLACAPFFRFQNGSILNVDVPIKRTYITFYFLILMAVVMFTFCHHLLDFRRRNMHNLDTQNGPRSNKYSNQYYIQFFHFDSYSKVCSIFTIYKILIEMCMTMFFRIGQGQLLTCQSNDHIVSYLMAKTMLALYALIYKICAYQMKC